MSTLQIIIKKSSPKLRSLRTTKTKKFFNDFMCLLKLSPLFNTEDMKVLDKMLSNSTQLSSSSTINNLK